MNPSPDGIADDHPMAAAVGAGTGTFAGAVLGTVVAGPLGTAVGAAIGAGAGSFAGEGVGDMVDAGVDDAVAELDPADGDAFLVEDTPPLSSAGYGLAHQVVPADEDAYWSSAFREQPYYVEGRRYEDYAPAYRVGYSRYSPGSLRDADWMPDESAWMLLKGDSQLSWPEAQAAMRAAWQRVAFRDFPAG